MLSLVPASSIWRSTSFISSHLEIDIRLLGWIGVDRHEIIRPAHLDAVTCIVKQPDISAL